MPGDYDPLADYQQDMEATFARVDAHFRRVDDQMRRSTEYVDASWRRMEEAAPRVTRPARVPAPKPKPLTFTLTASKAKFLLKKICDRVRERLEADAVHDDEEI